jgi:hypothetical protein
VCGGGGVCVEEEVEKKARWKERGGEKEIRRDR